MPAVDDAFRAQVAQMTPNELYYSLLAGAASGLTQPLAGAIGGVARDMLLATRADGDPQGRFGLTAGNGYTLLLDEFGPAATLLDSAKLADDNARFASARDTLWQAAAGFAITASQATLLATPGAKADGMAPFVSHIGSDGSLHIDQDALIAAAKAQLQNLNDTAQIAAGSPAGGGAAALGDRPGKLPGWAAGAQFASQSLTAAKLPNGYADKALGVAASAAFKVSSFLSSRALNSAVSASAGMGPAAFTGVGVALMITQFALNASGLLGPSPEQVMLEQINALRQQVEELRVQMHARFDRLEAQMTALDDKLNQLSNAIAGVSGSVRDVLTGVGQLQSQVQLLATNLYAANQADRDFTVKQKIANVLGYEDRQSDGSALPAAAFSDAEATFYTLGSDAAYDAISLPSASFKPEDVASSLTVLPFESQTRFLNAWPSVATGGSGTLTGGSVPNSHFWALATRAEGQLLLENPGRVTPTIRSDLQDLIQRGQSLVALQRAVARPDADPGPNGSTQSRLFNTLTINYQVDLVALRDQLRTAEADYVRDQVPAAPDQTGRIYDAANDPTTRGTMSLASTFKLFGGSGQAISDDNAYYKPTKLRACDHPDIKVDMPNIDLRTLYSQPMVVGRLLRLWDLDVCFRTAVGAAHSCNDDFSSPFLFLGLGPMQGQCAQRYLRLYVRATDPRDGSLLPGGEVARWRVSMGAPTTRGDSRPPYSECVSGCTAGFVGFGYIPCFEGPIAGDSGADQSGDAWVQASWGALARDLNDDWDCGPLRQNKKADVEQRPVEYQDDFSDSFTAAVDDKITTLQGAVLPGLRQAPVGSDLGNAWSVFEGDAALVRAYVQLGFPRSSVTDDDLQALLNGGDGTRLLDATELRALFAQPAQAGVVGDPLTRVLQDVTAQGATPRVSRLERALNRLIPPAGSVAARSARATTRAAAGVAGSGGESNPLVQSTLDAARLAIVANDYPRPQPQPQPQPQPTGPEQPQSGAQPAAPAGSGAPASPSTPASPSAPASPLHSATLKVTTFTAKAGTTLSVTLARASKLTATLKRQVAGHKVGKRCVAGRKAHAKRCTAVVTKTLTFAGRSGLNRLAFGKRLPRGKYTATVTAAGGGAPVTLRFTVR